MKFLVVLWKCLWIVDILFILVFDWCFFMSASVACDVSVVRIARVSLSSLVLCFFLVEIFLILLFWLCLVLCRYFGVWIKNLCSVSIFFW